MKKHKKNPGLNGCVYDFSVDYRSFDTRNIIDIHKYLIKKHDKIMLGLIKKIFTGLLTGLVNGSNHTKCESVSNQKCIIEPTLINLHPDEYSQEFQYYPFAIRFDRCVGSWNTLNDLSNKLCVPNKTEDLNLSVFNMIKGKNESKMLTKDVSCESKSKFDRKKYNSIEKWNYDKCRCKCKKHHLCEKDYIWNPATGSCENGKYLASIIDDSVITCDEIIDADMETKSHEEETKTNTKNIT